MVAIWKWWLGVGCVITALTIALPASFVSDFAYLGIALSASVGILLGVRWRRPAARAPWLWLAAGFGLFFVGEVIWYILERSGSQPFPSVADVVFLAGYPCLALGVALLVRERTAKPELSSLIDAAIVAVGVGVLVRVLVLEPILADVTATPIERALSVAYPVLDLLLLAVLARLTLGSGRRPAAFFLLTAGLILVLASDIGYSIAVVAGTYTEYGLIDGGWMLSYVIAGVSALHPSMRLLTEPTSAPSAQLTPQRFVALAIASIIAPGLLLFQWLRGAALHVPVIATAAIILFMLVVVRISELGRMVAATRTISEERFRSLVHNATDIIAVVDRDGIIRYVSPSLRRIWGHEPDQVIGSAFRDLLHQQDVHRFAQYFATVLKSEPTDATTFDGRVRDRVGQWRSFEAVGANLLEDPAVEGVVLTCRDTTERTALEQQLAYQAFHDPLTALPNRALFLDRVDHALDRQARRDNIVAVLFVNLDDFKTVNDGLGHAAGDELLVEIGKRLTSCLRAGDTAARLGGDEFAILLEDTRDRDAITSTAQRLLEVMRMPFTVGDLSVAISASIGIATGTAAESSALLVRDADIAMHNAKIGGKGNYAWFDPPMRAKAVDRLALKTDLAHALERDQFFLHFQPIVRLADGHILGAEALLRWQHPSRGLIPPSDFIGVAENNDMIGEIGAWVLATALSEAARWPATAEDESHPWISVNVSAVQLRAPGFENCVHDALGRSSLPPSRLLVELTETTLMEDIDWASTVLERLKSLGIGIAVDDFGTGYSSLAYLRQFPIDVIKIDRSFVSELRADRQPATLVEDIIHLTRALNVANIAEGIENEDQLASLKATGCTMGQGFYLGMPMSSHDFALLLSEGKTSISVRSG